MRSDPVESALTNACKIKIPVFEGPFDLLFHLIEKNQVSIYDIPISEIADQYLDYLFAMQEMDMEIASEFLVTAATLLHIKSRMLIPERREKTGEATDPREELVEKLLEYKKYKDFSQVLRNREEEWENVFYRLPWAVDFGDEIETLELSQEELKRSYLKLIDRIASRSNNKTGDIVRILQREKVSLRAKMREVISTLIKKAFFKFADMFSPKSRSRTEIVTAFLAILELSKLKKVRLVQKKQFSDIYVYRNSEYLDAAE